MVGGPLSGNIDSDELTPLFKKIQGIAVDYLGNIYIADSDNRVIKKITRENLIYTVAGLQFTNYSGWDNRQPARLSNLGPITAGPDGAIYFRNDQQISKLTASGELSNLAGPRDYSRYPKDGVGGEAAFDWIQAMAADKLGNLYICDSSAIRKITPNGIVSTLAGKLRNDDKWETSGYVDGEGNIARFYYPDGIAVNSTGTVFVMDGRNKVIRKIEPNGMTSTFVGKVGEGYRFDAKGEKARLGNPRGLAIDVDDNLYFSDGPLVRKVYPDGDVLTIGGNRSKHGLLEGIGEDARFGQEKLNGLAVAPWGTLYLAYDRFIFEADSVSNDGTVPPTPELSPLPAPILTPSPSSDVEADVAQLLGLTLSTTTVDITNGAVVLQFTANVTNSLNNLNISFSNNYNYGIYGYASTSNNYQPFLKGSISIKEFSRPGLWTISSLSYSDEDKQWKSFYGDQLKDYFESIQLDPLSFTVINSIPDTKPPELHKLEFLSTEGNPSNKSAKIRYRVVVKDDRSGLGSFYLSMRSSSDSSLIQSNLHSSTWDTKIVAVSDDKVTYEGILEIPQGSADGEWKVDSISLTDQAGNFVSFPQNSLPLEITTLKITTSSSFANPVDPEDLYHPWVVGFEIEPASVDVSSTEQKVTVRVMVNNDDLPQSASISAYLRDLDYNYNFQSGLRAYEFKLVSGTVANGIYEAELVVPKNFKSGNYILDSLSVYESYPSYKNWSRYGSNISPEFRKTLVVSSISDTMAPELQSITISTPSVNTLLGKVTLSVNLHITDDVVGLLESKSSWENSGAIGFSSPSGVGYAWADITSVNRISGDSSDGTYLVWLQLPQYSEEGIWTLDYVELRDANYNTRYLIPANLKAMGIEVPSFEVQGHPRGWEQQSFTLSKPTKGNATIQLSNLTQTADGTDKVPSVLTTPSNLTQNVTLTFNGVTTPPVEAGNYTVVAYLNDPNYRGREVATLTITDGGASSGGDGASSGGGGASSGGDGASSGGDGASSGGGGASSGGGGASSGGGGASSGGGGASSGGDSASSGGGGASSGGDGASSGGDGASSGGDGASSGGDGASSGGRCFVRR